MNTSPRDHGDAPGQRSMTSGPASSPVIPEEAIRTACAAFSLTM
jgi:hypothetical protein